jgi:hypothetical protein
MGKFLIIVGALFGVFAFMSMGMLATIMQQILVGIAALAGAVFFSSGCIVIAIDKLRNAYELRKPMAPPPK